MKEMLEPIQKLMPDLTIEQAEPIACLSQARENVLVSAGAGSGKTKVLTSAFACLVREGKADMREILTITFTDRAASELKERLTNIFSQMQREDLRREVEEAYVSTMHSFASRILKEYALEAGVDPEFQVATEDVAMELELEAWDALMDEEAGSEIVSKLMLAVGSAEKLRHELIRLRRIVLNTCPVTAWKDLLHDEKSKGEEILVKIDSLHEQVLALGDLGGCAEAFQLFSSAREIFRRALEGSAYEGSVTWEIYWYDLNKLKGSREAKDLLKITRDVMETEAVPYLFRLKSRPHLGTLVDLLEKYDQKLEGLKRSKSLLDFDDLLRKLYLFLSREDEVSLVIRSKVARKFKFILMDEFQDSNHIEIEILKLLSSGKNLFLVGDAKQSIYGFRQADVGIFLEERDRSKVYPLTENYRSQKKILDFVNAFFGEYVFRSAGSSRISYEALKLPEIKCTNVPEAGEPAVECYLAWDELSDKANKKHRQRWEAEAIAIRILEIMNESLPPDRKPYQPGDFAILLKSFSDVALYENALRRKGISCSVVAGRGYYQKIEVRDITNFLKILERPHEDIALAGLLRSPLVGLSDDGLFVLSKARNDGKAVLWNTLDKMCKAKQKILKPSDRKKIGSFLKLHGELRIKKNQLFISELIREVILKTGYETKILLEEGGRQKFANLEKLLEIARAFDRRSLGLAAFLRDIERLADEELSTPEAQIDTQDKRSVKILTVHKAKGLEFPVVILANFDAGVGAKGEAPRFNYSKSQGIGYSAEVLPETAEGEIEKLQDLWYSANKAGEIEYEKEEAKRVFYVACTRAKDRLILSAAPAKNKKDRMYLNGLLEYLECGCLEENIAEGLYKGLRLQLVTKPTAREEEPLKSFFDHFPKFQKAFARHLPYSNEKPRPDLEKIYRGLLEIGREGPRGAEVSVTGLLAYQECPKKYHFRYILNMPAGLVEPEKPAEEEMSDETEEFKPADYGTRFHYILEHWDYSEEPMKYYQENIRPLLELEGTLTERLRHELELFACQSELAKKLHGLLCGKKDFNISRELSFEWNPRKHFKVRGQIDMLYLSESGEWHLVDYKTNQIRGKSKGEQEKELEKKIYYYKPQLSLYGALVMKALDLRGVECALYFSTLGELRKWKLEPAEAKKELEKAEEILERVAVQDFKATCGKHCDYCDYLTLCRREISGKKGRKPKASKSR